MARSLVVKPQELAGEEHKALSGHCWDLKCFPTMNQSRSSSSREPDADCLYGYRPFALISAVSECFWATAFSSISKPASRPPLTRAAYRANMSYRANRRRRGRGSSHPAEQVRTRGLPKWPPSNFLNLLHASLLCPKLFSSANLQQLHQSLNRRPTEVTADYTRDTPEMLCNRFATFKFLPTQHLWGLSCLCKTAVLGPPLASNRECAGILCGTLTVQRSSKGQQHFARIIDSPPNDISTSWCLCKENRLSEALLIPNSICLTFFRSGPAKYRAEDHNQLFFFSSPLHSQSL